ncbi:hypothetical protein BDY24DRAFT_68987 [Mrakia frigida]|uniref:uncharacterized protein n=1 Tax=Mrakia frigida TaxID=29902 RepID=UPI003FCC07DC
MKSARTRLSFSCLFSFSPPTAMLPLPHSRPSSSSESESASVDLTPPTPQQLGVSFRLDSEGFKQLQSDLLNPRGECIVFEASQNHLADWNSVAGLSTKSREEGLRFWAEFANEYLPNLVFLHNTACWASPRFPLLRVVAQRRRAPPVRSLDSRPRRRQENHRVLVQTLLGFNSRLVRVSRDQRPISAGEKLPNQHHDPVPLDLPPSSLHHPCRRVPAARLETRNDSSPAIIRSPHRNEEHHQSPSRKGQQHRFGQRRLLGEPRREDETLSPREGNRWIRLREH